MFLTAGNYPDSGPSGPLWSNVENQICSDTRVVEDVIGTLKRYGWNVDRKSLAPVLVIILNQLKAHRDVADLMVRYLQDPELLAIDTSPVKDNANQS